MVAVRTSSGRIDALDGLRGFALLGMMAWHAQVSWVQGGFARMTIFFVLAGFLAARSLDRAVGGTVVRRFGSFWSRRAQRLMPVTLLSVAAAIAVTWRWGGPASQAAVVGDATSVLTFWSNWRFVVEDRSYGALFEAPSAFQHFWSLSLEEQCLFVLPLVLAGSAWATRSQVGAPSRSSLGLVMALAAVCGALPLVWEMSPDTAYYGTHVRLGEFLVGVAVAMWWSGQQSGAWTSSRRLIWGVAGTLSFAALVTIMLMVDRDSGWVYRGGMWVISFPVAAVIVAIMSGSPVLSRVLGLWPLAALGRAAFSIYALHWPIFLIVESELSHRARHEIVLVSFVVSILVGAVTYRFYERPLMPSSRTRVSAAWARPAIALPSVGVGVVAVLVAAAVMPTSEVIDFEAAAADAAVTTRLSVDEAMAILDDPEGGTALLPVIRDHERTGVALFGGSTALTVTMQSAHWERSNLWAQPVPGFSLLGCGVIVSADRGGGDELGERRHRGPSPAECSDRITRWAASAVVYDVDVAVVVASSADLISHRLTPEGPWLTLDDPQLREYVRGEIAATLDAFGAVGVERVLMTNHVAPDGSEGPEATAQLRERMGLYEAILDEFVEQGRVELIDMLAWTDALSDDDYAVVFPDGIHASEAGAQRVWAEVLGPAINPSM